MRGKGKEGRGGKVRREEGTNLPSPNPGSAAVFYRHYRSISNHCDIIGLKICRIP